MDREITHELEDVVRDLAAALLGREVTFGEVLPYPGDSKPLYEYWEKQQAELAVGRGFLQPTEKSRCSCTTFAIKTVNRCRFHKVSAHYLEEAREKNHQQRVTRLARVLANEKLYVLKIKELIRTVTSLGDLRAKLLGLERPPSPHPTFKPGEVYGYHPLPEYLELPSRATDPYADPEGARP